MEQMDTMIRKVSDCFGKCEKSEEMQVNMLLLCMGPEAGDMLDSFALKENQVIKCATMKGDFDIHAQSHEWFTTTISKLWPLFLGTVGVLERGQPHLSEQFWNLCVWTGKQDEIKRHYQYLFPQRIATRVLEMVLFVTAVLEHSLGKIYLLKGNNVPFLLRDLLPSQEVKSTVGIVPVVFMQILFGTPLSLNLRNIAWHGFPSAEELQPHFATVLIVLVASLGEVLQSKGVSVSSLPSRPQVTNLHQLSSALDGCFPDLTIYHKEAAEVFRNCHFIAPRHKATWDVILQHYINCRYGQSLALLLPHMEQLLRCVFCWTNNCPQRLLTAETTEFYTTFDEILAENIPCDGGERINVVRQVLGDCVVEMLLDTFTHHAGPRIRDKLSHGECEFGQVPKILVNHIICVSLAVVCKSEKFLNKTACAEDVNLMEKIECDSEYYVSKFSSFAVLKRTVTNNIKILEEWKTAPQPNPEEITFVRWHEYFENNNSLLELKRCLCNRLSSCNGIKNKYSCDNLHDFVQAIRVSTVYRPKSEIIFISLLRRIVDNVTVLCTQVNNVLQEKYSHYNMHKLRTRQRKTYHQILNECPNLYTAVQCVIILVVIQLLGINSVEIMGKLHFYNLSRHPHNGTVTSVNYLSQIDSRNVICWKTSAINEIVATSNSVITIAQSPVLYSRRKLKFELVDAIWVFRKLVGTNGDVRVSGHVQYVYVA